MRLAFPFQSPNVLSGYALGSPVALVGHTLCIVGITVTFLGDFLDKVADSLPTKLRVCRKHIAFQLVSSLKVVASWMGDRAFHLV